MTDCKIAQEILIGRHDDDLPALVKAIGERAVTTRTEVRWRLTLGDLVVDEENLTLLELERVENLTGKSWLVVDPRKTAGYCIAMLQAAIESREGLSPDDARKRLTDITAKQIADEVLSEYVVQPAPFGSESPTM